MKNSFCCPLYFCKPQSPSWAWLYFWFQPPTRESTETWNKAAKNHTKPNSINGRRPQWKTTLMEDDLNGRQPQWKTTTMEDDHNERRPQMKTASIEDELNGRRSQWKTTSRKPYRKQMTSACLASQFRTELGPYQPQLVLLFFLPHIQNFGKIIVIVFYMLCTETSWGWAGPSSVQDLLAR